MKRIYYLLSLIVVLLTTSLNLYGEQCDFKYNGLWYVINPDSCTVSVSSPGFGYYSGDIVIPNEAINGEKTYVVSGIGKYAFKSCDKLSSVSLPSSITTIGYSAFGGCSTLNEIALSENLTSIDKSAFADCKRLREVYLPDNLTFLGESAFYNCNYLTTVRIGGNLKEIPETCFSECPALKDVYISNGVEKIGRQAFAGMVTGGVSVMTGTSIETVILPPSIKEIGRWNFYKSNVVLFNGDVSLYDNPKTSYYILDTKFPKQQGESDHGIYYVYDKESFLQTGTFSKYDVHQLNEGLESISLSYTGYPQGPNRNNTEWPIGNQLRDMGISYTFNGIENTNCGNYHGLEDVTFTYDNVSFTTGLYYDYTITPIPLSLKIDEQTREFGEPNPAFTCTCTGFVGNDNNTNALDGINFVCEASESSDVGSYSITLTGKTLNYTLQVTNGILNVTQAPIVLTIHNKSRVYGDSNPKFTYEVEGNKFSESDYSIFSVRPTLTANADRMSDVGTYPIMVSESKSKNYFISSINEGTLEITKAPATLKVLNATKKYGEENPQFSFSVSNLRNGDNASCVTVAPTYLCEAGINSQCGNYVINAENAESKNYTFEYVPGNLTITKVPLTLVAGTFEREYGEVNPEFTYTARGLVASDELNTALTQSPRLSTTANAESPVGVYAVSIGEAASNNYNILYESGTLDITKAPLIIKSADATTIYGEDLPKLTLEYIGFKLSDSESTAFISMPTSRTDAFNGSPSGQYAILCEGGEAKNYYIVERKEGILTVSNAPLTLSSDNKSRSYGEPNPEFSYTLSNLKNNDDESCITIPPLFKCEASAESDCGVYSVTPSGASAVNYDISYQPSTLTVTKSPLNISVKDCSRVYGDPNPKFELIFSGFRNGDDETSISKLPEIVCDARPNSPVGYYDINLIGGESTNYDITLTPGILTIEQAPLIISAKNVSRQYGHENPAFEPIIMGFKNNDDANVLFKQPVCSSEANVKSPVGDYPIQVANASAQNYAIVYEPGVLSVTKSPLIATVNDFSRQYGEDNPTFSIEYSGFLNDDDIRAITVSPQFKTIATNRSDAGQYSVHASGASSPNYDIQYIDGTLTVNPKQISASVGNYTRPYGTENPSFAIVYNGLVNGDIESAISIPTTATCEASINSALGQYPIVLSGGRGQNYEVTSYTNGVLTVERATQTIEWNQDLSSLNQYDQVELTAVASSGLPITYEIASNNVVDVYTSGDKKYLDCYGTGTVTIRATQKGNENYYPSETITNRVIVSSEGGNIDPSNPEISINVSTPGTLSSKIASSKKYQIRNLTVSGTLNGTDIRYLREMAGRDVNGNSTTGILEKLNLSRATIVTGGDYYYTSTPSNSSGRKYTSNNTVSDYMFFGCSSLTNLTLPQNCIEVGEHAFDGCSNLSNISWSDDIVSIGTYAFKGNISLTRISIPKNTTTIGNYAFSGCTGLNKLMLSSSVKNIGDGILNGCPNIEEITLPGDNPYYTTSNGVLYDKSSTTLITYPAGKKDQTFEIPDGVTVIRNSGFYGVTALNYLFLPESLTYIGTDAFKGCGNLSKLYARPTEPAECANSCFESVSMSNCTLYVPRWSGSAYWVAPVWGDFLKIEAVNDLSVSGNVSKPDYCFEFTETTLSRGKMTPIPVSMNNVDPVVGFQCDIVLPEGIKLYEDAAGTIVFKPSERFPNSQRIESRVQSNGDVRLICSSTTNEPFSGTEGILFYIPLFITDLDASIDSEYKLTLKNIEFTKKNQSGSSGVMSPDIEVTLTVGQYSLGDANGDGRITVTDAVMAKGYILGDEPSSFIFKAADMNFDGKISITDVVLITDEILAQNKQYAIRKVHMSYGSQINILSNGSEDIVNVSAPLEIRIPEASQYTALQLDITVPEGIHITEMSVGENNAPTHKLRSLQHMNGLTRVFLYSDDNENFIDDKVLTVHFDADEYSFCRQNITIDDILAVEISGRDYNEVPIEGVVAQVSDVSSLNNLSSNGIIDIWTENSILYIQSLEQTTVLLFDIAGHCRQIDLEPGITEINMLPGIYFVNNKKILIK